ncbi:hypothetical protein E4U53_003634 [Claviceps sorghi]|nr:hypothetical protein E4U53_003634 [Claviceps sorghi]
MQVLPCKVLLEGSDGQSEVVTALPLDRHDGSVMTDGPRLADVDVPRRSLVLGCQLWPITAPLPAWQLRGAGPRQCVCLGFKVVDTAQWRRLESSHDIHDIHDIHIQLHRRPTSKPACPASFTTTHPSISCDAIDPAPHRLHRLLSTNTHYPAPSKLCSVQSRIESSSIGLAA